jgi:hypothetical protein
LPFSAKVTEYEAMNLPATVEGLSSAKRMLLDAAATLLLLALLGAVAGLLLDTPRFDWLAKAVLFPLAWPLVLFNYFFPDNSMSTNSYIRAAPPLVMLVTFVFDFAACSFFIDCLLERYARRDRVESGEAT